MGGKLGTKIHEKVAAIISTEDEVKRMSSRMREAKDFGIQVIPEDFLDDVKSGGAISYITSKSLCDWGTDVRGAENAFRKLIMQKYIHFIFIPLQPHARIPQDDLTKSKSKSIYTKSVPKSQTLKLKGGNFSSFFYLIGNHGLNAASVFTHVQMVPQSIQIRAWMTLRTSTRMASSSTLRFWASWILLRTKTRTTNCSCSSQTKATNTGCFDLGVAFPLRLVQRNWWSALA